VTLWIAFLYAQTFCYVVDRQGVTFMQRLATWIFLTPALYLFQLLVVGPAMVAALLTYDTSPGRPEMLNSVHLQRPG